MDLAGLLVGLLLGAGGGALAVWMLRRAPAPEAKLTAAWSLAELAAPDQPPLMVARDVGAVPVPAGARIVASGLVDPAAQAVAQVRQAATVAAECAVAADGTAALLFLAGVSPGARALVTRDAALVGRLRQEAEAAWARAEPYVERLPVSMLPGRTGAAVETRGRVMDALPHEGGWLMRVEDLGAAVAVRVPKDPAPLRGADVQVRGRLVRGQDGYPVLQAEDVRRLL